MSVKVLRAWAIVVLCASVCPSTAQAAEGLAGGTMSAWWALPFAGLLLSIATGPLFFPHVWEHHYGKFAAFWAACVVIPLFLLAGSPAASSAIAHTVLLEYIPFILLLTALFVTAGGIYVQGNLRGTPATNGALLGIGTLLASVVGTTGASIIMIRPLLRANDDRVYKVHVVVFFIFLVSNIGGSLTPLGDPPLFVGFLKGVDFFWTTIHLWKPMLLVGGIVLAAFLALDIFLHRREERARHPRDPTPDSPLRVYGLVNVALLAVIIGAILLSANWKPGIAWTVLGSKIELQNLVRDAIFVLVALASLRLTDPKDREANGFSWGPIQEVALLFAGIFICIVPVIAILQAGSGGAFAPLVALVTNPDGSANNMAYFWLTGVLSSFLDNAPTYLVFFELAGGDPQKLMGPLVNTLVAISAGAVFMGANSYIGNAPNFMVYAIAREAGVNMPSFFGYMMWSGAVLIPTFIICGWVFFR